LFYDKFSSNWLVDFRSKQNKSWNQNKKQILINGLYNHIAQLEKKLISVVKLILDGLDLIFIKSILINIINLHRTVTIKWSDQTVKINNCITHSYRREIDTCKHSHGGRSLVVETHKTATGESTDRRKTNITVTGEKCKIEDGKRRKKT
jgi:hypothetical protein